MNNPHSDWAATRHNTTDPAKLSPRTQRAVAAQTNSSNCIILLWLASSVLLGGTTLHLPLLSSPTLWDFVISLYLSNFFNIGRYALNCTNSRSRWTLVTFAGLAWPLSRLNSNYWGCSSFQLVGYISMKNVHSLVLQENGMHSVLWHLPYML